MNPLKVYGGDVQARYIDRASFSNSQLRAIVLASSRQEVLRVLLDRGFRVTLGHLRHYWCETGNERELKVAREAARGAVLVKSINDYSGKYLKV